MFSYRALGASGKMIVGTMEASTRAEVIDQLDRANATPVTIEETTGEERRSWRDRLTIEPAREDITGFTVDLAMLLKGGVTLNDALLILTQMETRRWLVKLIERLHADLSGGKSFSVVLAQHPRLFPPLYVKMIEVAEVSGRLEQALTSIAAERQRSERLRKRLIAALAYPAFLAVAALGVLAFVLLYIIPQFEGAIAGFRDRISPSALFVFRLSEWFRGNVDLVLIAIATLLLGFMLVKRLGQRRSLFLEILAVLPMTSRIVTYHLTLTFCRTLEILLENGVDISTALRLIRGIHPLPSTVEKVDGVIADVRGGKRLTQALATQNLLPVHVVQMLRVGEESGHLADSAGRIAGFYETKLDAALARLTAVAGPLLMMGVSMLIGWLILSIMSALMSINDLLV
ncbi:type II secretion system F family protein [Rhizobium sp. DKSPLA3]|uniref:Type II secretion system F family protein n=1 Tax=Rhizobium quercicola TaxID=2901226 RepID=A0A9X1NVT5_9HYPH|nr:type II secretion system F family protein [Rhizobium quercicola]